MITLAATATPVKVSQKREGYDNGFRLGVFDKCNGRDAKALDGIAKTKYNKGYRKGYLDGYCSSDRMVT